MSRHATVRNRPGRRRALPAHARVAQPVAGARWTRLARKAATAALLVAGLLPAPAARAAGTGTAVPSGLNAVACPSVTVCVAVGAVEVYDKSASGTLLRASYTAMALRSTDGGKDWVPVQLPSVPADLTGVSCMSTTACIAVGATETVYDGLVYPVGAVVLRLSGDAGQVVRELPSGARALLAVSCNGPSTCLAAGGADRLGAVDLRPEMLATKDAGSHWTNVGLPIVSGQLQGISCGAPSQCVAVGVNAYVADKQGGGVTTTGPAPIGLSSSDGGRSWKVATLPPGPSSGGPAGPASGGPDSVSCSPGGHCVAAGDRFNWCQCGTGEPGHYAMTWSSDNGGATWSVHVLPTISNFDVWYATSVSCWAGACAVAGTGSRPQPGSDYYALFLPLSASGTPGGPLASSATSLRPQWVDGLSCHAVTACVAVGEDWSTPARAAIETRSGARWATTFTASPRPPAGVRSGT